MWEDSTERFRENHLISKERRRQRLLDICESYLGQRNSAHVIVNERSQLYETIYDACSISARNRIELLQHQGCYGNDGKMTDLHSIILSAHKDMIITVSPLAYNPGYDLIVDIKATNIRNHLALNRRGEIFHFKR